MWVCVLRSPDLHTKSSWEKPMATGDCMVCEADKLNFKAFLIRVTC